MLELCEAVKTWGQAKVHGVAATAFAAEVGTTDVEGENAAFVGDGNNVANSIILCGALLEVEVRIACPKGYEPSPLVIKKANEIYRNRNLLKHIVNKN